MNFKVLGVGIAIILLVVGVLLANIGRDPHTVTSPLIGRPAPPFTLPAAGGGPPISLEALRGQPVVINFWATWCVPCFQEHATLVEAARVLQPRVKFVGVVYQDEPEPIVEFLEKHGASYPSLVDGGGRTAIAYGVFGVPETFFVDSKGTIVDKYVGPLDPPRLSEELAKVGLTSP